MGPLNSCVILEKSLSYLRFSSSVSNGDAIFMQDRISVNAKWDNTLESAFIKKKKDCLFLKWKTSYEQKVKVKVKLLSRVQLFATPMDCSLSGSFSMGFSRQECWSGLPFPSPGDLPNPGIEPGSPSLQADALPSEPPEKPANRNIYLLVTPLGAWTFCRNLFIYYSPPSHFLESGFFQILLSHPLTFTLLSEVFLKRTCPVALSPCSVF